MEGLNKIWALTTTEDTRLHLKEHTVDFLFENEFEAYKAWLQTDEPFSEVEPKIEAFTTIPDKITCIRLCNGFAGAHFNYPVFNYKSLDLKAFIKGMKMVDIATTLWHELHSVRANGYDSTIMLLTEEIKREWVYFGLAGSFTIKINTIDRILFDRIKEYFDKIYLLDIAGDRFVSRFCEVFERGIRTHFELAILKHLEEVLWLVSYESTRTDINSRKETFFSSHRLKGWHINLDKRRLGNEEAGIVAQKKAANRYEYIDLGNSLSALLATNFGYGSSSYFFLTLKYRSVQIRRYSAWVEYRYRNAKDIVEYTYKPTMFYTSWKKCLELVADAHNLLVTSEEAFIDKWIITELEKLTTEVDWIFAATEKQIEEKFDKTDKTDLLYVDKERNKLIGYPFLGWKCNTLCVALEFIESILELQEITDIKRFVDRLNLTASRLKGYIANLKPEIEEKNDKNEKKLSDTQQDLVKLIKEREATPVFNKPDYQGIIWEWKFDMSEKHLNDFSAALEQRHGVISVKNDHMILSWNINDQKKNSKYFILEEFKSLHNDIYSCMERKKRQLLIRKEYRDILTILSDSLIIIDDYLNRYPVELSKA